MKQPIMISIIVPIKGHRIVGKLLAKLERIRISQEYEILVVDSSPGSLNDLQKKYQKVRWIDCHFSKAQSIPEQRNFGIKKANGEIIVFIDADCIPTANWLANLTEPILTEHENITCGLVKSVRKYPLKWKFEHDFKSKYVEFAPTMNSAFKRSVIDKIGPYDPKFGYGAEDLDYCWRAIKMGYKIRFCQNAVIYHDWGDIKRNFSRMYGYGQTNFVFFQKHFRDILRDFPVLYGTLAYPLFILGLPLTILFPYYPLLIIIPFIKTLLESKSLPYAIENIYFNFLYGAGFLVGAINT